MKDQTIHRFPEKQLELRGRVRRGDQLGRSLGYPTANLTRHYARFHPVAKGVYAGWARVGHKRHRAVAVVGVDDKLEVHLIGWHGILYGKCLRFVVVKRLRGIQKFKTGTLLKNQIRRDIRRAVIFLRKGSYLCSPAS